MQKRKSNSDISAQQIRISNSKKNLLNWLSHPKWIKIFEKIFTFLTFSLYIMLFLEELLFLLISIISEIKRFEVSSSASILSKFAAFVSLSIVVWICIFFFHLYKKNYKSFDEKKNYKIKFLFNGLKNNPKARFNSISFILIRVTSIVFLIWGEFILHEVKTTFLSMFHITYALFLWIIQPYQDLKTNITDSVLQMIFIIEWIIIIPKNTKTEWTGAIESLYLFLMMSGPIIASIISIVFLIKAIWIKIAQRKRTCKVKVIRSNSIKKKTQNIPFHKGMLYKFYVISKLFS